MHPNLPDSPQDARHKLITPFILTAACAFLVGGLAGLHFGFDRAVRNFNTDPKLFAMLWGNPKTIWPDGSASNSRNTEERNEANVELAIYRWASSIGMVESLTTTVIDPRSATAEVTFKDGRVAKLKIGRQQVDASSSESNTIILPKGTEASGSVTEELKTGARAKVAFESFKLPWAVNDVQITKPRA